MLENEEIRRLLNSAPVAFRPLLAAAFFTGARYGEVVRMRVRDFDADAGAVHIHQTKTGKTLCQPLDPEGYEFFISRTAGRAPESLMFTRDGSEQGWGKSHQARPTKEAAARAGLQDVSFKVTRATYGKRLLLATKDIELVAKALGHSDSRITRKHYAQYLPNEVAVGVRSMEPIGIAAGNVFPLRKQAL